MNAIVKLQHICCCATVLSLCQYYAAAQSPGLIKGKITDESGNAIPAATVSNKNLNQHSISAANGSFSIQARSGDSIIVQMIGYDRQGFVSRGSSQPVNITLHTRTQNLKDVVVTALGIKREERELGYAFSEVNGDDINKAKETNVINSLAGKVAGLVINSTAGGPSGSSRVIIRGNTSITGNNQPLYVIDGIPMDNSNYGQVGNTKFAEGVDMGDAISAINPDDIEKISVLKGPSASALYGSSAANGVILITTKKGTKSKDLGIELNSTSTIENQLTKVNGNQYLYGQGMNGQLPQDQQQAQNTMFTNFGPRLDPNVNIIGFDGVSRPYALAKNNFGSFFRTGSSFNNTLSLTNGNDRSNFRFSASDLRYQDIVPNSDIRRNNFSFSARSKFGQILDLDARATYLNERVNNRQGLGDAPTNIGQNFNGLANNVDQSVFSTTYKSPTGEYVEWGGGQYRLNPYWVLYEMSNVTNKDRLTGSFNANITISKSFSLLARASTDITFLGYQKYSPKTTPLALSGMMNTLDQKYTTNQADLMATFTHKLSPVLDLSARAGISLNQRFRKGTTGTFSNMTVTDVKSINSYQDKSIEENNIRREVRSAYGLVTLGYRNFLYLDGTIRTDGSSTLPKGNNVYTYPSLSTSFIFTDAFNIKSKILSFGKFRASWAEVGSDTDPYMLDLYYSLYPLSFNGSQPANISTKIIPNANLKPTRTRSFETGVNLKFFNGRLTFDGTYYTSHSRDQINIVPAPVSSGFAKQIINAGMITNKGIELMLSGTPISRKNFSWDVSVNFARNVNNVESLAPDVPFIALSEARWLGLLVAAMPGQRYGAILGYDYQRDPEGNIILNPTTLNPIPTTDRRVLGKGVFDWTGGLSSRFNYKNFSLNANFDVKYGADIFSMTDLFSVVRGSSVKTLPGREEWIQSEQDRLAQKKTPEEWRAAGMVRGYVPEGVVQTGVDADGKPQYTKNTRAVDPSVYWGGYYSDGNGIAVPFIYKATYVKVRDITLSYRLPRNVSSKLHMKDAQFGFVARNPFIIYKDIPNVDPDSNYNNSNGQGLEYGSLPSRRGWGINLNVKF
ncbi:TonB-linked SusC/RagA family outer membrane protein [Chitinophaga terrae (ex Kim and Jung 2007)]|uniref:SusC/RagA family TonB-linked outer membrane protein n=1 Tax=Chitinophaga terrae (ex Kim and Jung 2007) TaxID=408074 RepID=UPI002782664D|nr:SusC/RagA family TonB-linked outer membrane protein [Chitinophaga terrae (ex Kim and Jung 2007)]MDQ0104928.1 TonB-linked SusC/RagA family outer membrane protein [Chitinophaga terrae (ex Kim and Jung 2007)]